MKIDCAPKEASRAYLKRALAAARDPAAGSLSLKRRPEING